jgi:pimeloyl-ACP methyl ester carboxylesterase
MALTLVVLPVLAMTRLKREDVELYYELSGHGPPVLLIQGVGVVGGCWRPQVTGLQGRFQMVLFDNRGIGQSLPCRGPVTIEAMAEDARALLDAVGWPSAHVVGHSMGGVIAQQLALNWPERVRSLSLWCTFARGKDGGRLTPWTLWMGLRTRLGSRRMRRRAFLEMLMPEEYLRAANEDELASRVGQLVGRDLAEQPSVLLKQVKALASHDCSKRLGELKSIPTMVVSAAYDPIALPRYGRMLAEAIPGASFRLISDGAHGVTIQKAEQLNQLLAHFLESIEAGKASKAV